MTSCRVKIEGNRQEIEVEVEIGGKAQEKKKKEQQSERLPDGGPKQELAQLPPDDGGRLTARS